MAKFVIECPNCGKYAEASTGIFAKKTIDCTCGYKIHVKSDKLTSTVCAHCGNTVVYDQSKGADAKCPVCHEKINTPESLSALTEFSCPSCACRLSADKNAATYTCPLCDTMIDVQAQIAKEKIKSQGFISVIKYEGGNDTFVWKHPIEDFNLGSQLIVHESQEAIFFRDGQALDLFGAGRYTLETQNIPLLEKLAKIPTGGTEAFHSEVYFINQTTQMGIKWGTDSKVRLFDPASGIHIEIGACGNFSMRVSDSRKLLIKLVGTAAEWKQDQLMGSDPYSISSVVGKFKALVMTKVKANLSRTIKENNIDILDIDAHIDTISDGLRVIINETLDDYGLYMPEFYVTSIMTPDDDPNFRHLKQQFADRVLRVREEQIRQAEAEAAQSRKLVEAQTEAQLKMVGAQGDAEALKIKAMAEAEAYKAQAYAEAEEMRAKGFNYQQQTARQVGLEAMKNGIAGEGGGSAIGDIAGLGVTLGAMGGVIGMTKDALNPMLQPTVTVPEKESPAAVTPTSLVKDTWECPECGTKDITSKFCPECGTKKPEAPLGWDCPSCGMKDITSKFCPECGTKKPETPAVWTCPECGTTDISTKFCPECGHKREE